MASDGSVVIDITGDSSGLEKAMNNLDSVVQNGFDKIAKEAEKMTNSFGKTKDET